MISLNIPDFDEEKHAYTVGGKIYPGVTSVISSCLGSNPFWTEFGRDFGRAVHKAIHYYSDGDLDFNLLDDRIKPRIDAYVRFCEDKQFKSDLSEQALYHPKYRYCGMIDQAQIDRVVPDFKCGQHLPEHGLQLAAYVHLLPNPYIYDRWGVQLKEDGKYKIEVYKKTNLSNDFNIFLSMLNIYNWRNYARNGN